MSTDSRPRLVYQIIIKAPREQVWAAITRPEFTSRYYYGSALTPDLTVGSPIAGRRRAIREASLSACDPSHRWRPGPARSP